MLAGFEPLVILYVPCDGTQYDLLHQLPQHRETEVLRMCLCTPPAPMPATEKAAPFLQLDTSDSGEEPWLSKKILESQGERHSSPRIIFVAILWTRSNSSMSFLCWGLQSWMQYSSPPGAAVGLLGCECTLLAHVQLFIHQHPQVLLRRAALNHIIPQPVLKPRIALNQVQDPALGLVEPHEVHTGPLLQLVQVPLDDILSFWSVNCTTQLGVICKLAEGALDLAVNVIDENTEQHWSQYGPLRHTTPVDCYPLDATIQPIPYPLNSPPIKSVSLQFREKDVVGDHVKGFTEVQIDNSAGLYWVKEKEKENSSPELHWTLSSVSITLLYRGAQNWTQYL
ncbi:hypothetical protein QYF61_020065, partial [Mycteria americana]